MATQYIYSDLGFQSPFVVTYVSTSLFFLYLPFWKINRQLYGIKGHPWEKNGIWFKLMHWCWPSYQDTCIADGQVESDAEVSLLMGDHMSVPVYFHNSKYENNDTINSCGDTEGQNEPPVPSSSLVRHNRMSHDEIIRISLVLAAVWFISNLMYSYSLLWTTIASSTIISNLSSAFTLCFAYFARLESLNVQKLMGVALCFAGVVLVTFQDSTSGDDDGSVNHSVAGDLMALGSALGYGLYTTYLRFHVPSEDIVCMELVLGYMGLACLVLCAPLLVVVIYAHVDNLSHFTGLILFYLVCTGLFDYVISDYLWARAILLTTPTVATVGLSITIPMAFLGDIILNGYHEVTLLAILGSLLVMTGFALVNAYGATTIDIGTDTETDAVTAATVEAETGSKEI